MALILEDEWYTVEKRTVQVIPSALYDDGVRITVVEGAAATTVVLSGKQARKLAAEVKRLSLRANAFDFPNTVDS